MRAFSRILGTTIGALVLFLGLPTPAAGVTVEDVCDTDNPSVEIQKLTAAYDGTLNRIAGRMQLCGPVSRLVKYAIHLDHTAPFIGQLGHCRSTEDDTMLAVLLPNGTLRTSGPGLILQSADPAVLYFEITPAQLGITPQVGDEVLVWADTKLNRFSDVLPKTDSSDGCSEPETTGEVLAVSFFEIPDLPGALTLNGCPGIYVPALSSPRAFSGIDVGPASVDTHSVATRCQADLEFIQTLIPDGSGGFCRPEILTYPGCQSGPNHNPDYPGIGNNHCTSPNCNTTPESADIFYDSSLSDPNAQPSFANCAGMQEFANRLDRWANYTYPGGTSNLPTPGDGSGFDPAQWNRVINVINGDANLSAADFGNPGAGIILVKGNLTVSGIPNYKGAILVIGTGSMTIGGGGSGTIQGGILLANTTTCPHSLGQVRFIDNSGGTFRLDYDSEAIQP